ncbi:MAG TPA: hypothetical protein VFG41_06360 [Sphingomicrobium sp.]|jgi:hypothetical protein|nr:hypothetical protein [Sphingomicrobium sp.]
MKAIIIVMLAVEAAAFLVAVGSSLFARSAGRRRPIWISLSISMLIVASAGNSIAERHIGRPGADVVQAGALVLIGMAIMTILMALRERRGLA